MHVAWYGVTWDSHEHRELTIFPIGNYFGIRAIKRLRKLPKLLCHASLWTSNDIPSIQQTQQTRLHPTRAKGTVDVIAKFCPRLKLLSRPIFGTLRCLFILFFGWRRHIRCTGIFLAFHFGYSTQLKPNTNCGHGNWHCLCIHIGCDWWASCLGLALCIREVLRPFFQDPSVKECNESNFRISTLRVLSLIITGAYFPYSIGRLTELDPPILSSENVSALHIKKTYPNQIPVLTSAYCSPKSIYHVFCENQEHPYHQACHC